MDIVVCVKSIPDPRYWDRMSMDPQTGILLREGIPRVLNPLDRHALEAALQLREAYGGRVTALSMGRPSAAETMYKVLAMGADEMIMLCDSSFAGADTLATAYVLAAGIRKLGRCDLVLCGNKSLLGSTGHVGPQLAVWLGIPHVTSVVGLELQADNTLRVRAKMDADYVTLEVKLPVVLAVRAELNRPRFVSLLGLLEARERPIQFWSARDLGLDGSKVGLAGSPSQVANVFVPETKRRRQILEGEPEEVSKLLLERLKELAVLPSTLLRA